MTLTLNSGGLAGLIRNTLIPQLFRRREERESVNAKVRPLTLNPNVLILEVYDLETGKEHADFYEELDLPMYIPLVRQLNEDFIARKYGTFKGEFILSMAGVFNPLGDDRAGLEGEITVGDSAYHVRFNAESVYVPSGSTPQMVLVDIYKKA
ncbi:hypothetical protein HYY71_01960 [Candidatus Woesearchaeota archaeon]|nr:hypothetical protein [Candidatus Woesearchaeota archaeon]